MPLVQLDAVTVAFGGLPVLDAVDLVVEPGERLCLLGRNGAGKSTLLRLVHGQLEPDAGSIVRQSGTRLAYLDQQVPADLSGTVLDVAMSGRGCVPARGIEEHLARAAISRVGLQADADVATLSAGSRRRALLAAALASDPDVLLLDEPTNHLDVEAIAWFEEFLLRHRGTTLFVTHDRAFLRRLATGILDLDRGALRRFEPDYDAYIDRKQRALHNDEQSEAHFDKTLAEEEQWIRRGVRERRKRNVGRVRRLLEMREQRAARRDVQGVVRLRAQAAAPSGRLVLEARDVSYAWPERRVVTDFTTTVLRGDRVGIVGPNGSGKTTLLRLLLGELAPTSGTVRQGTGLQIGYFDQLHADLDENATAADNVSDGASTVMVNGVSRHVIGYLRDMLFTPDQARSPIKRFSGGERNRLLLARLFARPSNVLVLDEPTNDLDVETLEVLEALLADYDGTVLVVSHDRALLDAVVTSLWVLGDDGTVQEHVGGYSDWHARKPKPTDATKKRKGKRAGKSATPPPALDRDERRELRGLPARLEALEAEQAALHERMAAPDFFRAAGDEIAAAKARLKTLTGEIEAAYARWEALEAKQADA